MISIYKILLFTIRILPAEVAHNLSLIILKTGIINVRMPSKNYDKLSITVNNINFNNPIGLAAGYDKNGEAIKGLIKLSFGFVEIGSVTPKAQNGNKKPRLFRLYKDEAIINRMGFNNKGHVKLVKKLERFNKNSGILGVNLGVNLDSNDPISDYLVGIERFSPLANYLVINISSPNTLGLRGLQFGESLNNLLFSINKIRKKLKINGINSPVFVKIAPDITDEELNFIIEGVRNYNIEGIVISNTTIERKFNLKSKVSSEVGGLSGKPLFSKSNELLRKAFQISKGEITLIGVGGVSSGKCAYEKICLGASLVQLYSGLIFNGPGLIYKINQEIITELEKDGFESIKEAIGSRVI
ncbi:quinone-dependent dihydroorotate dehydrogenase [Alphaproteobacteria bacterium]|nr:quinone-dependent dihydroorotate dehydrogenase [Alphaproteobacteria bacterium]